MDDVPLAAGFANAAQMILSLWVVIGIVVLCTRLSPPAEEGSTRDKVLGLAGPTAGIRGGALDVDCPTGLAALVQSACNKPGSIQITHNHVRSGHGAWIAGPCRIPKLTVRVRFPSPAPHAKSVAAQTN
jgi:hypothetical protein